MRKAKQKQQPMAQTSTQCSQTCLGMRDLVKYVPLVIMFPSLVCGDNTVDCTCQLIGALITFL